MGGGGGGGKEDTLISLSKNSTNTMFYFSSDIEMQPLKRVTVVNCTHPNNTCACTHSLAQCM